MKAYTVKLTGLSAEDARLCELLWTAKDVEDPEEIIAGLPQQSQSRARALQQMMVLSLIDQIVEEQGDYAQARDILSSY